MTVLRTTFEEIDEALLDVASGLYAKTSTLNSVQTKANQNEADIATNQAGIAINQTDIAANVDKLTTLSGVAGSVTHNTEGPLTLGLAVARQYPVVMTANVSQLNLSNGVPGQAYIVKLSIDNAVRTFAFGPDLDQSDTAGVYDAGDVVTHPNGRVYKAAIGQSGLKGAEFQADLDAGDWALHIRTNNDDGYFPSQEDEDILRIDCIGTDYYKITPYYGS